MRYLQSSHAKELQTIIWSFGLFIASVFSLLFLGLYMIESGSVFRGINLVFCTIASGALVVMTLAGTRLFQESIHVSSHRYGTGRQPLGH